MYILHTIWKGYCNIFCLSDRVCACVCVCLCMSVYESVWIVWVPIIWFWKKKFVYVDKRGREREGGREGGREEGLGRERDFGDLNEILGAADPFNPTLLDRCFHANYHCRIWGIHMKLKKSDNLRNMWRGTTKPVIITYLHTFLYIFRCYISVQLFDKGLWLTG